MNCTLPDGVVVALPGLVTAILTSVAVFTFSPVDPTMPPKLAGDVAVMVADPGEIAVMIPLLAPEMLTVATPVF